MTNAYFGSPDLEALLDGVLASRQIADLRGQVPDLDRLTHLFYQGTAVSDLKHWDPVDIVGAVISAWSLAQRHRPNSSVVRTFTPTVAGDGWTCEHTAVEIVTDDMPFIIDSVVAALNGAGRTLNLVIHPVLRVTRAADGAITAVQPQFGNGANREDSDDARDESWVHIEIDRESNPAVMSDLTTLIESVLNDVRDAVTDWPEMVKQVGEVALSLEVDPPTCVDGEESQEAAALLRWMVDNHFTFLGYREYDLINGDDGIDKLVSKPETGLGILRSSESVSKSLERVPRQVKSKAREQNVLVLTKANRRSTVHRPAYLDYVGVKQFDADGRVIGERRILGLLAATTYADSATAIPVVRRTIQRAIEMSGYAPGSHSARDLLYFCETYPRDELFQISAEQLLEVAREVIAIAERRQTKMFFRSDDYGRFESVLVYLPRDRYTTKVRIAITEILAEAYGSDAIDYVARVSESVLARLHFVVRMPSGVPIPDVDAEAVSALVTAATRSWMDDFNEALTREVGEERATALVHRYGAGIPESYKENVSARAAVADVQRLDGLEDVGDSAVFLHDSLASSPDEHQFTLYSRGDSIALYEVLPIFASMGARVLEERPYGLIRSDLSTEWIYDVSLRLAPGTNGESGLALDVQERFCEAFLAAWRGDCEVDRLNELVSVGGLSWREISWLRAWIQYARQLGTPFSYQYIESVILANNEIARLLVQMFTVSNDPDVSSAERVQMISEVDARLTRSIDEVSSLDADRILRQLRDIVVSVLRTNAFQLDEFDQPPQTFAMKLETGKIPSAPAPAPRFEIWVSSPRVSGVHLRFGAVARGGLRWSDRPEDFRTEILGLVKAQMVKNAVIVPVGAKGGFYVKRPRNPADRALWMADGIACYREFITAMLQITDNLVGGEVVPPPRTVRWDGDDTYLVVAADKGTASFSDIANELALEHGFWLGDAFASGGSHGYDHKAMGITAKGAWESVQRHFREMDIDVQTEPITVVGVGDMSGDVFGNGMLLSRQLKLVAAFDHRHVFLDPDPDPALAFAQRERLAQMGRSSWADYEVSVISGGGGVYPRTLKKIPISKQVRAVLALPDNVVTLTPDELVRAILKAPVDLLWNGGIGTYVKASWETDALVGDKSNDAVRVNGEDLHCQVVGEGGNLGLTQPGRIEAAERGVRLNTDAIDNSAGVDCSDHEVNIKILLDAVVADGELTVKQRNEFLAQMTDEVSALVLSDNYQQNLVLGNSRAQTAGLLPVHRRLIDSLVSRGLLDRELEYLPTDAELAERGQLGQGLVSPELCVLLSYVKIALTEDLLESDMADEAWCESVLTKYFPPEIVTRYRPWLESHPLRSQIIATRVANEMVDCGGLTFVYRAAEETGASPVEIARAYTVSRDVFDLRKVWDEICALDGKVPTEVQASLFLEVRRLLDRSTRWLLSLRGGKVNVVGEVERFGPTTDEYGPLIGRVLVGSEQQRLRDQIAVFTDEGVPPDLSAEVAAALDRFSLLDIDDLAKQYDSPTEVVAELYFAISEHYGIDMLLRKISELSRGDRWSNLARAALRSDLYSVLASLTSKVLRATDNDEVVESRVAQWAQRSAEGQQRARATLAEIEGSGTYDLATLSVALRVLRTLVKQGARAPADEVESQASAT